MFFLLDFLNQNCYDFFMFFGAQKKYYTFLLEAEDDARQIRSMNNLVIASNSKGLELFGTKENPFAFLQNALEENRVQKLIDAYCTQSPIELEIKTLHSVYNISLKKVKNNLLLVAQDVSNFYAIHNSLTNQVDFLSHVLSNFDDAIYLTDQFGTIIYVNKTFCSIVGARFDEILGQPLQNFILDGAPDFNGYFSAHFSLKTQNGPELFFLSQQPFKNNDVTYFSGKIKRPEKFAFQSSLHLFKHCPIPCAIVDALDYTLLQTNDAFSSTFKTQSFIEKTSILHLLSNNTQESFVQKLKKMIKNDENSSSIEVLSSVEFSNKSFTIFIGFTSQEKDSFVLYFVDASDRKNLENQFAHAQKMQAIGQLAGGIAHDFNNLLTAIIGFCDLLLQRHDAHDPSFFDIMQIKGNANKASGLVGQLLTFSRKQPCKVQVIDFYDAFIDISALLQRSISPFISLKTEIKKHLGSIKMDPNQLTQIFLNLAVNAKDAMKNGGTLFISASKEKLKKAKSFGNDLIQSGDYIKIIVSDTGCGISSDHLMRIFEPFFTTKNEPNSSGTGLGLSTVYGIIRSVGGYISADSEQGIGTTFTIYLPQIDEKPLSVRQSRASRPIFNPTATPKILLVDDEDGVRLVVSRVLKTKGFLVTECANAEQALDELNQHDDFDLLLTDMIMPGIDGETLIKKAKEAYPRIKTILMSGYSEDLSHHISDENAQNFILKPFELNQLLEKVVEVIEK